MSAGAADAFTRFAENLGNKMWVFYGEILFHISVLFLYQLCFRSLPLPLSLHLFRWKAKESQRGWEWEVIRSISCDFIFVPLAQQIKMNQNTYIYWRIKKVEVVDGFECIDDNNNGNDDDDDYDEKNEERNLSKFHINFTIHCKTAELLSWKKQSSRVESVRFRSCFCFWFIEFFLFFLDSFHFIPYHLFVCSFVDSFACVYA